MLHIFIIFLIIDLSKHYTIDKITPLECSSTEYFNFGTMNCMDCTEPLVLEKANSGFHCKCKNGYREVYRVGQSNFEKSFPGTGLKKFIICASCADISQIVSSDGRNCIECPADSSYSSETRSCVCRDGYAFQEYIESGQALTTGRCVQCISPFASSEDALRCERCTNDGADSNNCKCLSNQFQVNGMCFDNTIPGSSLGAAPVFSHYLRSSYLSCTEYQNKTSCQLLGNLCVLSLYDMQDVSENTFSACSLYEKASKLNIDAGLTRENNKFWPSDLPYLIFPSDSGINFNDLPQVFTLSSNDENSFLKIVVAKYTFYGEFLGFFDAYKDGELQLCKQQITNMRNFFLIGKNSNTKCNLLTSNLFDEYITYFYDVYIQDNSASETRLYSVPLVFEDLAITENGQKSYPNTNAVSRLTRRMFLVDNMSYREGNVISKVTYLEKMLLKVTLDSSTLRRPIIYLKYKTIQRDDAESVLSSQSSEFVMSFSTPRLILICSVIAVSCLGILWSFFNVISWTRRNGSRQFQNVAVVKFVLFLCHNLAHLYFMVLLVFTCTILAFWKGQTTVFFFLPTSFDALNVLFYVTCGLKLVDMVHFLVIQCSVDIFLIDFERPKKQAAFKSGVSMWRTYFIANEWNEIQILRKTSVNFQLLAVIFVLKVCYFENWARADTYSELFQSSDGLSEFDPILRFAIAIFVYFSIWIIQWVFEVFIQTRFVESVLFNFVDLCTVCNVSVFITTHEQFGFYIHGCSVHGFADVDMKEMYKMWQLEKEGLATLRGLDANGSSQCQLFEMVLPGLLRETYVRINRSTLSTRQNNPKKIKTALLNPATQILINNYSNLNEYLYRFIRHNLSDCDFDIVEQRSFFETFFDVEFKSSQYNRGIFYEDKNFNFATCMLYGNEFNLFVFDALVFLLTDWFFSDFIVACVGVYVFQYVVISLRNNFGRNNLAHKTLVDERYLI